MKQLLTKLWNVLDKSLQKDIIIIYNFFNSLLKESVRELIIEITFQESTSPTMSILKNTTFLEPSEIISNTPDSVKISFAGNVDLLNLEASGTIKFVNKTICNLSIANNLSFIYCAPISETEIYLNCTNSSAEMQNFNDVFIIKIQQFKD